MQPADGSTLVIVGSGGQPYREYAFRALSPRYRLAAVLPTAATWQRPYLADAAVADPASPESIAEAVSELTRGVSRVGLLTWDETVLETTAHAAELLGLPHMPAQAVTTCRDKYLTRSIMSAADLPAVRYRLVNTVEQAVRAAGEIGFPVVVKPRTLAGSVGVAIAPDERAVREVFGITEAARYATLPTGNGVLVEEYLDGPEISVDSAVFDGTVHCVHVAHKRLGFAPWFEEVGHLITDWSDQPWAGPVQALVSDAHRVLGVTHGVTHAEIRLTAAGPRLVELNGRLGGDLIPYASELATGVDLVVAAAELAFGRRPSLTRTRHRTVEIQFVYPPYDCVVQKIDVSSAASVAGIAHATALAAPGDRLRLPPNAAIPRLAVLVADGSDEEECADALERAEKLLTYDVTPIDP
jgi:biotin carboxylase